MAKKERFVVRFIQRRTSSASNNVCSFCIETYSLDPRKDDPKNYNTKVPSSCKELMSTGSSQSGVYNIKPNGLTNDIQVYCELTSAGGGWTLIASVHENNINGKCTAGDLWSNDQGITPNQFSRKTNWENFETFGHVEGSTSSDYKSAAYFSLRGHNLMIWHVPNDVEMPQWQSSSFLQYYTTNGFLSSYGGTLQTLFLKYFPMTMVLEQDNERNGLQRIAESITSVAPNLVNLIQDFFMYSYDGSDNSYINDGGSDMYDNGNKVFYKIGEMDYVQVIYEKQYTDINNGVQLYSMKLHPFVTIMWVSNPSGRTNSFGLKVVSGTGADSNGNFLSYTGSVSSGNLTCKYQSYNVYGTADPSISEVYFSCYSVELWNSVPPSGFIRASWSSQTDNLVNAVSAQGHPQSFLMGYLLLSRSGGLQISEDQVRAVLERMMQVFLPIPRIPDPTCARLNESLAVEVEYVKGDDDQILSRIPPLERKFVEPRFIHFRPLDQDGNPNALCPGVKSLSCHPQSFCIGGIGVNYNSTELHKNSCGDFAGWNGLPSDNATVNAKSLSDIKSSILIFIR
ncbi:uncharacterized protein LOC143467033 isoform X3 [Clavelina lepadiformis]|uniref:uncharacterized protein LOC143467033 isoform X3 n=1 Tax=Clavelina lepadiformis TaxID=159417 RepID=UPI0040437DC9